MMPPVVKEQAPIPPPSYQRAQARLGPALHIDALTLVTTLHLLTLCRLAVRLAHRRCPPPLPAGPGGAPLIYSAESLLLIGLLRTLWRLSYQDMHDWLKSWPGLALACGLPLDKEGHPRIPSKSQQCKRRHAAGAPLHESLFVLTVLQAVRSRLIGARDLIIDSAPIAGARDAAILMQPSGMPPLIILALFCEAFVCILSSVEVQDSLSFSCFLLPIHTMPLLRKDYWQEPCISITSVPVVFAWMQPIGACAS
jgi:hypothetical protein